jgi:hypothetical protein
MRTTSRLFLAAMLAASLPASAADSCQYAKLADLPIRYVSRSLLPAIDGTLNNKPAVMVMHSSSYTTWVTSTGVARHDLAMRITNKKATGIGGYTRVYNTHVKGISIGPVRIDRSIDLPVMGDTTFAPEYDVAVGGPFLMTLDLMIDLRAKQMQMYQPQGCMNTELHLWKEDTFVIPVTGHTQNNPNPHFTVIVNGRKLDAVFGFSSRRSYLTLDGAEKAGIDVKGPGVERLADAGGVGGERAPNYIVPVKTIQIGSETVNDATLGVVESKGEVSAELYLGQDFLRAHRVLFANSQDKIYVAYLGGNSFARGIGIEPWIIEEANGGNPHAQYALGHIYVNGIGTARDNAQGRSWMEKAAAQGQPNALLYVARRDLTAGKAEEAIPKLESVVQQLPADKVAAMWLYNARVRSGQAEAARIELQETVKRQDSDDWPYAITQFYLGKWNEAKVLDEAGQDKKLAQNRTCQAENLMADWHISHGNADQAKALQERVKSHCGTAAAGGPKTAALSKD